MTWDAGRSIPSGVPRETSRPFAASVPATVALMALHAAIVSSPGSLSDVQIWRHPVADTQHNARDGDHVTARVLAGLPWLVAPRLGSWRARIQPPASSSAMDQNGTASVRTLGQHRAHRQHSLTAQTIVALAAHPWSCRACWSSCLSACSVASLMAATKAL